MAKSSSKKHSLTKKKFDKKSSTPKCGKVCDKNKNKTKSCNKKNVVTDAPIVTKVSLWSKLLTVLGVK